MRAWNYFDKSKFVRLYHSKIIVNKIQFSWNCSHNSDTGGCVKAKLDNSDAVWSKTECDDSSTKGVVCARRYNWEDIGMFSDWIRIEIVGKSG